MTTLRRDTMDVASSDDIVRARQAVRALSVELGFSLVEQTKLVTAASELARNMVIYGHGGKIVLECVNDADRLGIRLTFEDHGPGIPDVEQALRDGYSTGTGLGMGLGGARRLVNDFEIQSRPGEGTRVVVARWKWKSS